MQRHRTRKEQALRLTAPDKNDMIGVHRLETDTLDHLLARDEALRCFAGDLNKRS